MMHMRVMFLTLVEVPLLILLHSDSESSRWTMKSQSLQECMVCELPVM